MCFGGECPAAKNFLISSRRELFLSSIYSHIHNKKNKLLDDCVYSQTSADAFMVNWQEDVHISQLNVVVVDVKAMPSIFIMLSNKYMRFYYQSVKSTGTQCGWGEGQE